MMKTITKNLPGFPPIDHRSLPGFFLARLRAGCGTQQRAYTDDPWCQLKEAL